MLRDALYAPGRSDDAVGTLVVGSVLFLVTAIIVPTWASITLAFPPAVLLAPAALGPAFVGRGYYVRLVAAGIAGTPAIPPFVRWGTLYRDGVKSTLLSIGYLLPLGVLLAAGALAAGFLSAGGIGLGEFGPIALAIVLAFLGLLTVGYLLVYAYLRPAGLAAFAATGRLRDAFDPRYVGRIALDGEFATGWLLAMVTLLTGLTIAIPFAPLLVGFVLAFFVQVVAHRLYGHGAAAVVGPDARLASDRTIGSVESAVSDEDASASATPVPTAAAEADPAVQTGRSVPLAATDGRPTAAGESDPKGDAEPDGESDSDGDSEDLEPGEFEWGDPVDR